MATYAPETRNRFMAVCLSEPGCLRPGSSVLVWTEEGQVSVHVRETGQRFGTNEAFFTTVGVVLTLQEWRKLGERRDELTQRADDYNRYETLDLPPYQDIELSDETSASVHVFEYQSASVRLAKFIRTAPGDKCQQISLHSNHWRRLMRSWVDVEKLIEEAST